jgi:O-antigen/teichoic acid export membrane protein
MLILPNDYAEVGDLLWIVFLAFPLTAVYYLNFTLMVGADRQLRTAVLVAALCIVQLLIGLVLIPLFGATGAAAAWATTSMVASLVSMWFVCHWFLQRPPLLRAVLPALSGWALLGGYVVFWPETHREWTLPAALALYAVVAAGMTGLMPLRAGAPGRPRSTA